jgi:hypothetical protein
MRIVLKKFDKEWKSKNVPLIDELEEIRLGYGIVDDEGKLENEWFSGNTKILDSTPPLTSVELKGMGWWLNLIRLKLTQFLLRDWPTFFEEGEQWVDMGSLKSSQLAWGS